MRWVPFAMVRITAVFITGIVFGITFPSLVGVTATTVFLTFLVALYFLIRFASARQLRKLLTGVIGLLFVFWAGYLNCHLRDESAHPTHLLKIDEPIVSTRVQLVSALEEKEKSWKMTGIVQAVKTSQGWRPAFGKVNVYWTKSEKVADLDYGDIILMQGEPKEIEHAYNPGEFDFSDFLRYRNIFHQRFLRKGEWILCQKTGSKGIIYYSSEARKKTASILKKYIPSLREQALVVALVIGVTDGLDDELLNAYSVSGTMHVLAVSGLHVSIIYAILLFLFKPFGKNQTALWATALVSLLVLWSYAFVTGLSPSVLRAVTMFSFVAVAKPFGRNTNIYNTLAASAFFLLLYDPFLIMSVGFQLSYLAVLGIVYLQRPLYNLWEPKSFIVDWAWQLSCVSIAAQAATFAVSLLYFHQFPVYFLVSNLAVIPASSLVLLGGILLLIISPMSTMAEWLGKGLEWFVKMLNELVFIFEKLPFNQIDSVFITGSQCLLLFLLLICVLTFLRTKNFALIVCALVCCVVFSTISWKHHFETVFTRQWIVYRTPGHSAMEWMENGYSLLAIDSALEADSKRLRFHTGAHRLVHGLNSDRIRKGRLLGSRGIWLYSFGGRTLLWIRSGKFEIPSGLTVDYVMVSNNSLRSLSQISGAVGFTQLILDASNSTYYTERLLKESSFMKISAYSVLKHGAFILNL